VVDATEVVVATTTEEEEVASTLLEEAVVVLVPAARTEEHAAWAALRTERASVAPQDDRTQEVAADWMAASLEAVH